MGKNTSGRTPKQGAPPTSEAASRIDAYIAEAPPDQRPILARWRGMIERTLPGLTPTIAGFPVYTRRDAWVVGLATRAKGPMLYVMHPGVLDRFEPRLGRLRSGKSCVDFKPRKGLDEAELWAIAQETLDDIASDLAGR